MTWPIVLAFIAGALVMFVACAAWAFCAMDPRR
jgi:hypothetical protein